jgi:hypothetical protein
VNASSSTYIDEFIASEDGARIIKAFVQITDPALRRRVVNLVQEIAGEDGE